MVEELNTQEFNLKTQQGTCVVDFFATWCSPCQMLTKVIASLSYDMENIKFYKVDVDKNPALASQYGVNSVPYVAIFKDGQLVGSSLGFKPKEILKTEIEKCL